MSTGALVASPDLLIRARAGRFVLQAAGGDGRAFETEDPRLVLWVLQFARPQEPAAVLGALPAAERAGASALLERLLAIGVLRPAAAGKEATDASRHAALVAELANATYELACDLRGMDPADVAATAEGGGAGVAARLSALTSAVAALREDLRTRRGPWIARQLASLGVSADSRGLKLHIGSGGHDLPGWVNLDVHPAPLALNVNWGLPFADGSARVVFVSHLLEHLFYPRQATAFLGEIRRVLEPGGVARIVVPDIEQCIRAYVDNDAEFFASRKHTWTWWPEGQTRLESFLAYAGAGPEPGLLFESHKFGYDFDTLQKALGAAGFASVRRCGYMQSPHPELRVDDASAVAGARHGERHYALFVEASAGAAAS